MTTVVLVVDPLFGERVCDLPPGVPSWIRSTAENLVGVKQARAISQNTNITTFSAPPDADGDSVVVDVLGMLDRHHNELAQSPPYSAVEVFGASPSEVVRRALSDYNLNIIRDRGDHFMAEMNETATEERL